MLRPSQEGGTVMGDLATDTEVEERDGHFVAELSRDWEIWGPNGGYVASIALRAAGARSRFDRPASIAVHYLGVAEFAPVRLDVTVLRAARRAESLRVSMTQGDRPILEAMVWTVDALEGLEHDAVTRPSVPHHGELKTFAELNEGDEPPHNFWRNFDGKPVNFVPDWPPAEAMPPEVLNWYRYLPRSTFDDPFVDASRALLLIDTMQWPAAVRPHAYREPAFIAPTIDLSVSFHDSAPSDPWLLLTAEAPIGRHGLIGGKAAIWSEDLRLLASGGGQLMCRPTGPR
jgi:acyl-CoA thioesterase-2